MLEKILYIAKWIAGVIGAVTAILGIVTLIYTQGIKAEQKKSKNSTIESKVDKLIVLDSIKSLKIDQMLVNQEKFGERQKNIEIKVDNLNRSYINHLKSDKRVDELINYLEGIKKNGETNLYPIVWYPIQQNLK